MAGCIDALRPASFLSPSAVSRTGVVTRPLHLPVFQRSQYSPILQPHAQQRSAHHCLCCPALLCTGVSHISLSAFAGGAIVCSITREQHPVSECDCLLGSCLRFCHHIFDLQRCQKFRENSQGSVRNDFVLDAVVLQCPAHLRDTVARELAVVW